MVGSTTEILEQLARGLEHASFEQRRELVELLVDRVVVTGDAVEIRFPWSCPMHLRQSASIHSFNTTLFFLVARAARGDGMRKFRTH